MAICSECGQEIFHGDWPFCEKNGGHSPARAQDAQDFIPPVIFKNQEGHILFPGRNDKKPPKGYEAVELRTSAEIHSFEKDYGERVRADYHNEMLKRQILYDQSRKGSIDHLRHNMNRLPANLRGYAERAIERHDNRSMSSDAVKASPVCVFEAFSFDSSNRSGCDDPRTTNPRQRK